MSALRDAPHLELDRAGWRAWLAENHAGVSGAWLVIGWPRSDQPGLDYEAAIEEALCFGWVDSTGGRTDDGRTRLYFAPRKPRSAWAASNRARVERLTAEGRMAPAGLAVVERARADGSWTILASAERLEVPPDLAAALDEHPPAAANFAAFPPSARKMLLSWIAVARRPATRERRVMKVALAAARGERTVT